MRHRIRARKPHDAVAPRIEHDTAIVSSFLTDAAHVPGGYGDGVAFPRTEAEVAALVSAASRVLPVGAQSSLTGGATPRGEVVLSTRALTMMEHAGSTAIRVGAGVPLHALQEWLAGSRLYYPPVPTYDGAFVGGTIATNAAGAATFKYGSTRRWVAGITVVLANGDVLDIARGEVVAADRLFEIESSDGSTIRVPVPRYTMPDVAKLSAGYHAKPGMDLVDLFIGSEGTLAVVVDATLEVIARPRRSLALIQCAGDLQAVSLTAALRREAHRAWEGHGSLDVAAIEYMDARSLKAVGPEAFTRAGVEPPVDGQLLLLVQIEMRGNEEAALSALQAVLDECGVQKDPAVTGPDDERSASRFFELREAVPAGVNAIVAAAKTNADARIEKTAGDMIVPFHRLADSIALYRRAFEERGVDYAIWGHVSDGNLHANVVPRTMKDVERGRDAILEMAKGVIAMGGAPLAEHGVGRSALKQRLLVELYGEDGIEEMRAVKRALDPGWKLAPGVLFPAGGGHQ